MVYQDKATGGKIMTESTWEEKSFVATFGEMMVYETLRRLYPAHHVERVTDIREQKLGRDIAETWTDSNGDHIVYHEVKCEPATLGSAEYHTAANIYQLIAQYMGAWNANPFDTGSGNSFIELCADIPRTGQGVYYVWYDKETRRGGWNERKPSKGVPHPSQFDAYGFTADGWYSIIKDQVEHDVARPRRYVWFVYPPVSDIEACAQTMEGRIILEDSLMLQCPDAYLVQRVERLLHGDAWRNLKKYRVRAVPRTLLSGDVKFSYGYLMPAFTREINGHIHEGLYEVPGQPQDMELTLIDDDGNIVETAVLPDVVELGPGAGATSECILRKLNSYIKPVDEWFK